MWRDVQVLLLLLLVSNVAVGRLRRYKDLLPQCQKKATKILSANTFKKAQQELRNEEVSNEGERTVPWAERFHNTDWGTNLYNISGKLVAYTVIFKVNSENIHESLAKSDSSSRAPKRDDFRTNWKEHVKRYRYSSLQELRQKTDGQALQSFAFVRDPLEHFVSGLAESYFRGLGFGPHPLLEGKDMMKLEKALDTKKIDVNATKFIIDCLIFGDRHSFLREQLKQWKHFFPQFFAIRKWQPQFIGQLDNFDDDWKRMQSALNIQVQYSGTFSHITQKDLLGLKSSLNILLSDEPKYMRALCHLLIRDYICLGFDLPLPCQDMYDAYDIDPLDLLASNTFYAA